MDPPAGFVCTVDVDVNLRAFVPHLTPQSVAVAFRMLDRAQQYSQYSPYWQSRPSVPVSRSPSCWWQHAGSAAARECKLISRRQVWQALKADSTQYNACDNAACISLTLGRARLVAECV